MPNLERRLPKLAAIAAPAFVWLAANACDTKTPPQTQSGTEPIPTQSGGTIDTNPQLEPTPGQVRESAINETNSNLVSIEGNNRYGLRTQVTIGELLETASLLSLRAPEVADTKIFVSAAKLKAEKDPDDPQITSDLLHAANILFAHSQICQDPQAGIGEVAQGYVRDIASYLNEHDQTNWEAQKSRFLESPCSIDPEAKNPRQGDESDNKFGKQTELEPSIDEYGYLVFATSRGNLKYIYKLIQIPNSQDPLEDAVYALESINSYINDPKLKAYISDGTTRESTSQKLHQAINMVKSNPNDPMAPKKILEASMEIAGQCSNGFHRTLVKGSASVIYVLDKRFWEENQFLFIDSNCFDVELHPMATSQ